MRRGPAYPLGYAGPRRSVPDKQAAALPSDRPASLPLPATWAFPRSPGGDPVVVVAYGAEQRVRVPAARARRRRQALVHWPFAPEAVQALLPRELVSTVPGLPSFAVHRRGLPPAAGAPACAAVGVLEETLSAAAGLPAPLDEPVVHHSPAVEHVRPAPSRPLST